MKYDVIIVGGGPSGIFSAISLIRGKKPLRILLVEKGDITSRRVCPALVNHQGCARCPKCNIVSGWGGAGAFSDGKLTFSTEVGGWLKDYIEEQRIIQLMDEVNNIYTEFGADQPIVKPDPDKFAYFQRKAISADLRLMYFAVRHLGTENCAPILLNMYDYLKDKIDIILNKQVERLIVEDNKVKGVELEDGKIFTADFVIVAPGREGAKWFSGEGKRIGLSWIINPVDIGVRVEIPAAVMKEITDELYEAKFIYYTKTFDDKVRTFCMNPYGEVVMEQDEGIISVNGHSFAEKKTENTNFAILVSKNFTEPFKDPIAYGRAIGSLANLLSNGVILQRLGDLLAGRRSTWERLQKSMVIPTLKDAVPGDLSLVLPYRYLVDIIEMIQALDKVTPGVYSRHTLLYGVEVKFYSARVKLSSSLETEIKNLFAIGDGVGVTRGLMQASISGLVVGKEILKRLSLYTETKS
ncbi:MAG TPA: NAD(P)/FAD-dependent oxidoreductase [Dictyoglomaceae bacterium]|nr:NAD(P)/FAD-dependent oxidoreductase [Dictyoglomaceae bacterium]HOL38748.1 NAD(P)/FAD-dependent oxidoreductase [Dictyoglomaceae bacterium]HOP94548.1 NAD(P)/FAD-dependent oxidoreductase [Dictyoglomaceae bacterium]HPP15503.1 NAD(P)/FAD-dependent oxidoreductase [Dictyoglomaceae bacterium]HPU43088.1 NAD(P)/FAD-dependent oxidoreductase [Dictyoglomaceae bacterium]